MKHTICKKCGAVDDTKCDPTETMVCGSCGSDWLEDAVRCDVCGEYFVEDDSNGYDSHVCPDCLDETAYDWHFMRQLGEVNPVNIEINGFLASQFSVSEIEDLMWNALREVTKIRSVNGKDFVKKHSDEAADLYVEYAKNL